MQKSKLFFIIVTAILSSAPMANAEAARLSSERLECLVQGQCDQGATLLVARSPAVEKPTYRRPF